MGTFDGAGIVLLESDELAARGVDSPVLGESGVAPERADGVLFAVDGDTLVGVGSRMVVGELDGHSLDIRVPIAEGRSNWKQEPKAEQAGISHLGWDIEEGFEGGSKKDLCFAVGVI